MQIVLCRTYDCNAHRNFVNYGLYFTRIILAIVCCAVLHVPARPRLIKFSLFLDARLLFGCEGKRFVAMSTPLPRPYHFASDFIFLPMACPCHQLTHDCTKEDCLNATDIQSQTLQREEPNSVRFQQLCSSTPHAKSVPIPCLKTALFVVQYLPAPSHRADTAVCVPPLVPRESGLREMQNKENSHHVPVEDATRRTSSSRG